MLHTQTRDSGRQWARRTVGGSSREGNVARERVLDGYSTPLPAIEALAEAVNLAKRIWEPANGLDAISDPLEAMGHVLYRSDVHRWSAKTKRRIDFVASDVTVPAPLAGKHFDIVTNPPFKRAEAFARNGLALLPEGGSLYLLLRLQFLEGRKRRRMFEEMPPSLVWVFSGRLPRMHRFDFDLDAHRQTKHTEPSSSLAFAWFEWRKMASSKRQRSVDTRVKWL